MPEFTSYPVLDSKTSTLYFIMGGIRLVAFDIISKSINKQAELKRHICTVPIIYGKYLVLCYEKQVNIYTKVLIFVYTYRLKGTVLGTTITGDDILQVFVEDRQSWDRGKSEICYSRLYEISKSNF
jgi:hypothetical protein